MAIYHFSAKVISRGDGRSAVAAAAYRSASELQDDRLGRAHDFTAKTGVVHSEILLPDGAPGRLSDRTALWNEVEATEKRKDAQLVREVEFALPREMNEAQGVALARDFVRTEFVERGMVADLNVHWDFDAAGQAKPHAHVMLTMREVGEDGFGKKVREWNATSELTGWRERWAEHVNQRMAELGHDVRIDHRTLAAQGVDLEPQHKIGPAGMRREMRGEDAERAVEHQALARRNGERLLHEPEIALRSLTHQHSTFTRQDLARFINRHTDGAQQFGAVMGRVEASPEIVRLGADGRGTKRFTMREMMAVEQRMEQSADGLADGRGHRVSQTSLARALDAANERGMVPGQEQVAALAHVTGDRDLALVVGYAGTGKSAMLGVAREAWEREGYTVRGAALSGIAAEGLEGGSGIQSRTIASLEYAWERGRDELTSRDVLVVDEAGMVGSRQMSRVLSAARDAGAKLVLVGDPEQLQAIEAGAAFRALAERHGAAEITEIRRQRVDWQRDATRELATGGTGKALDRYEGAGMVHAHATRGEAKAALVERWNAERQERPDQSQVILAYTRADVRDLNAGARAKLHEAGELGADQALRTERGERSFATGDRLMFLRNERSLEVKNGTLGTVEAIERAGEGKEASARFTVRLDGEAGRTVSFDLKDYDHFDHGYAATIHKTQGVTVDRTHVLATSHMDRHAAYVALSRHRDSVELYYGRDDLADHRQLVRTLSRERAKDVTLDYPTSFAERRGITPENEIRVPERVLRDAVRPDRERSGQEAAPKRGMFDGLRLNVAPERIQNPEREGETRTPASDRTVVEPQREQGADTPRRSIFAGLKLGGGAEIDRDRSQELQPGPEREAARVPSVVSGLSPGRDASVIAQEAPSARAYPSTVAQEERTAEADALRPMSNLERAVDGYTRAMETCVRLGEAGQAMFPEHQAALEAAGRTLEALRPGAQRDFHSALDHDPQFRQAIVQLSGRGRSAELVAGMDRERQLTADPNVRATRLVERWNGLEAQHKQLRSHSQEAARGEVEGQMRKVAEAIGRDPQVESVLRNRAEALGIGSHSQLGRALEGEDVAKALRQSLEHGHHQSLGYGLSH